MLHFNRHAFAFAFMYTAPGLLFSSLFPSTLLGAFSFGLQNTTLAICFLAPKARGISSRNATESTAGSKLAPIASRAVPVLSLLAIGFACVLAPDDAGLPGNAIADLLILVALFANAISLYWLAAKSKSAKPERPLGAPFPKLAFLFFGSLLAGSMTRLSLPLSPSLSQASIFTFCLINPFIMIDHAAVPIQPDDLIVAPAQSAIPAFHATALIPGLTLLAIATYIAASHRFDKNFDKTSVALEALAISIGSSIGALVGTSLMAHQAPVLNMICALASATCLAIFTKQSKTAIEQAKGPASATRLSLYEPLPTLPELLLRAKLTPRECDAVLFGVLGLSSKDAARAMGISPSTVRTHQSKALCKLDAKSLKSFRATPTHGFRSCLDDMRTQRESPPGTPAWLFIGVGLGSTLFIAGEYLLCTPLPPILLIPTAAIPMAVAFYHREVKPPRMGSEDIVSLLSGTWAGLLVSSLLFPTLLATGSLLLSVGNVENAVGYHIALALLLVIISGATSGELLLVSHRRHATRTSPQISIPAREKLLEGRFSDLDREIALLIASGKSAKDICSQLDIAPGTVKSARHRIYHALSIHSANELRKLFSASPKDGPRSIDER